MSNLTTNSSGGNAYSLDNKTLLAKYAVTGTFGTSRVVSDSLDAQEILKLAKLLPTEFVAKTAIYSRLYGQMKDMSVLLVAYLSTLEDKTWFNIAFDNVCDNLGQVRKFVKVIRDGVVGRKSLGTAPKKAIQRFLKKRNAEKLFWQSIGTSPSLADVIKLARPRPENIEKDAFYAYTIGKSFDFNDLPEKIRDFENFKTSKSTKVPDVPYGRLTSLPLTTKQWKEVFLAMTWNQLRKNLNTAARKGLFSDNDFTQNVIQKLTDKMSIPRANVFPFSIVTSITSLDEAVPATVVNALKEALEITADNTPVIKGNVAVILDVSGSMSSAAVPYQGYRGYGYGQSGSRCVDVGAFYAASLARKVEGSFILLPVDTRVHTPPKLTKDTGLYELSTKLAKYGGGGTNLGIGMEAITKLNPAPDLIIIISDLESWVDGDELRTEKHYRMHHTSTMNSWRRIKANNPNAKLVCWDITPNRTSQAPTSRDIMNVGGLSDNVFDIISLFYEYDDASWVKLIEDVPY